MSDFESTANAAVAKLQEIDEIVTNSGQYFTDAESNLTRADAQVHQLADQLSSTADTLVTRIAEARSQHAEAVQQLVERMLALRTATDVAKEKAVAEFETVKTAASGLMEHASSTEQTLTQHVETARTAVEDLQTTFDVLRQSLTTSTLEMNGNIQAASATLQEVSQSITSGGQRTTGYVSGEMSDKLREQVDAVREHYEQLQSELDGSLTDVRDQVDRTAADTLQHLVGESQIQMQAMLDQIEQLKQFLDGIQQKSAATGDTTAAVKDTMNSAMQMTNAGLSSAVKTLQNLKEIFEKVM